MHAVIIQQPADHTTAQSSVTHDYKSQIGTGDNAHVTNIHTSHAPMCDAPLVDYFPSIPQEVL